MVWYNLDSDKCIDNRFQNFAYNYLSFLSYIQMQQDKIPKKPIKKAHFWESKPIELQTIFNLEEFHETREPLDTIRKCYHAWFEKFFKKNCYMESYDYIKEFALFLRIAEKNFFYNNADDNCIFSEINENKEQISIYFIPKDFMCKIKVTFEMSDINIPQINDSILADYLEGKDIRNRKVEFVKIEVFREFGKQMKNEFKFIMESDIILEDYSDDVLFSTITQMMIEMISDCYLDILNNYIPKLIGFNSEITVKEVLNNDVWVWR